MSLAVPSPISPINLKRLLELKGYEVIAEDAYNWLLAKGSKTAPVPVPKLGDLVPVDVFMDVVFTKAGMNLGEYIEVKNSLPA